MLTIFHLSDLHLGIELIPTKKQQFSRFSSHDERVWMALRDHLLDRIKKTEGKYIVVITGDLSQFGKIDSYNLAHSLIFKNDQSDFCTEFGLQLEKENVLIVPGNHDSYDNSFFKKNNLRTFNNLFYPNKPDKKVYPIIKKVQTESNNYVFIGLDSTFKKNAASLSKKLGKGVVTNMQLNRASGNLEEIDKNTIRIVCLHHNPIIVDNKRNRTLMLHRSHDLLTWITQEKINYILCGHLHDDFYDFLPLEKMIKFLPIRKNISRIKKRIFKETQLNDYTPIKIKGKSARYIDSIAYHYIKQTCSLLEIEKGEFKNINQFNEYIRKRPEYTEFQNDFKAFDKKSKHNCEVGISRHRYDKVKKNFITKYRVLKNV